MTVDDLKHEFGVKANQTLVDNQYLVVFIVNTKTKLLSMSYNTLIYLLS